MLTITKKGNNGEESVQYSHLQQISPNQINQMKQIEKNISRKTTLYSFLLTGALYISVTQVPPIRTLITKKIKLHPLLVTGVGLVGFYSVVQKLLKHSRQEQLGNLIQSQQKLPTWKKKQSVIQPSKAYFSLDDNKNNEPNILHDGISASSVDVIYPDSSVGGQLPHHPQQPRQQHHDHH